MSAFLPPLKAGEYDLANISNVGFDPVTRRPFDTCHAEWQAAFGEVQERLARLRWWDLPERIRVSRQIWILRVRQGM